MPSKEPNFGELAHQIKITNKLLALQVKLASGMSQSDLIRLIAGGGVSNKEVAEILGTTEGTVRATLHRQGKPTDAQGGTDGKES